MKYPVLFFCLALTLLPGGVASAQGVPPNNSGNRLYNPFRVEFRRAWEASLTDPVKLIEIAPVTDSKRNNLLLLVGGKTKADTQRQLRVTHWNGFQFINDGDVATQSITLDTLLTGHFYAGSVTAPAVIAVQTPTPDSAKGNGKPNAKEKPKKKADSDGHGQQVVINAGVYVWANNTLTRVAAAPPDAKIALVGLDRPLDQLIGGSGDTSIVYEFGENDLHAAKPEPLGGNGYTRFGVGMQDFGGSDGLNLAPGVRYVQSIWSGKNKWIIGLVRGKADPSPDYPNATSGDRLVVYTPRLNNRDKSFWASKYDELEEAWRSEPLPGHVLDVRVGDPKNDGKNGILILTSENSDKDRHLYFFAVSGNG